MFVNAAFSNEVIPQSVPAPSSDTTGGADSAGVGVRYAKSRPFPGPPAALRRRAGNFSAGLSNAATRNLFAKVTAQLGVGSRLAVSHNYGHGNVRDETLGRARGFYPLSSAGSENPETINATRLAWTRGFATRFSNQLIVARVDDRRTCIPNSSFPRYT